MHTNAMTPPTLPVATPGPHLVQAGDEADGDGGLREVQAGADERPTQRDQEEGERHQDTAQEDPGEREAANGGHSRQGEEPGGEISACVGGVVKGRRVG